MLHLICFIHIMKQSIDWYIVKVMCVFMWALYSMCFTIFLSFFLSHTYLVICSSLQSTLHWHVFFGILASTLTLKQVFTLNFNEFNYWDAWFLSPKGGHVPTLSLCKYVYVPTSSVTQVHVHTQWCYRALPYSLTTDQWAVPLHLLGVKCVVKVQFDGSGWLFKQFFYCIYRAKIQSYQLILHISEVIA